MYITIPKYDSTANEWSDLEFETKEEFIDYVKSQVKLPGFYGLKDTETVWRMEGNRFRKDGYYCKHVKNSREYIKYWEFEKKKCRLVGDVS